MSEADIQERKTIENPPVNEAAIKTPVNAGSNGAAVKSKSGAATIRKVAGLSSEEVSRRRRTGHANRLPEEKSNSTAQIIRANVFTYFNAIFFVLAALLIAAGQIHHLTFLLVVAANTVIGILQQLQAKAVLDKLALLDVSHYTAIRDGRECTVPNNELVLGDVIRLTGGQQVPADAVVLSGDARVNESLLTGESDEIEKTAGAELLSGSFLVSGDVLVRLTRVGSDSYAAKLTAKAKAVDETPSEMVHDIDIIIRVAGVLIIPIGAALVYQAVAVNHETLHDAVPSMVAAVIGMIPEGLYLLVTVTLAVSAAKLAGQQVLLHDMRSIEMLSRVDVLCVDKTGTITESEMSVSETFGVPGAPETESRAAKELLARYIATVPDNNSTMAALRKAFPAARPFPAATVQPFRSSTKYSEVKIADTVYRLGAPEYLLSERQRDLNRVRIEEQAGKGQRVLAFVKGTQESTRPILFLALSNRIRENAKATFEGFARQGVAVKVISGDNPLTVSRVALEAGIRGADRYVDAGTLETEEDYREAVRSYTVFGRVKPEQKKKLVCALQANGKRVAMTGDGVNDILAMKAADCSIAMGGGSDAARQAAQVVLLDSDFSHMRQIVSEGRQDINNITRSAILFLYKNIFSLLLAVFSIINTFAYPLRPNQVSLISFFNIGLPALLLTFETNEKRQKGKFIRETLIRSMPAALTSFFFIAGMVLFGKLFEIPAEEVSTASVYLLSVVGYLILGQITQPMNRYRVMVFVVSIGGFIFTNLFLREMFDMRHISLKAVALCLVFVIAQVTVMQWLTKLFRWIDTKTARVGSASGRKRGKKRWQN